MVRPQSRKWQLCQSPSPWLSDIVAPLENADCLGFRCPAPHYWRLHYDEHCLVQLGQHPLQHDYHHRHPAGGVAESDALAITTQVGDTALHIRRTSCSLSLACSTSTFGEHEWKTNEN